MRRWEAYLTDSSSLSLLCLVPTHARRVLRSFVWCTRIKKFRKKIQRKKSFPPRLCLKIDANPLPSKGPIHPCICWVRSISARSVPGFPDLQWVKRCPFMPFLPPFVWHCRFPPSTPVGGVPSICPPMPQHPCPADSRTLIPIVLYIDD